MEHLQPSDCWSGKTNSNAFTQNTLLGTDTPPSYFVKKLNKVDGVVLFITLDKIRLGCIG